jgi:hypothetical protein
MSQPRTWWSFYLQFSRILIRSYITTLTHPCVLYELVAHFSSASRRILFSWWAFVKFNKHAPNFIPSSLLQHTHVSYTHMLVLFCRTQFSWVRTYTRCDLSSPMHLVSSLRLLCASLLIKIPALNLNKGVIRAHKRSACIHLYKIHTCIPLKPYVNNIFWFSFSGSHLLPPIGPLYIIALRAIVKYMSGEFPAYHAKYTLYSSLRPP